MLAMLMAISPEGQNQAVEAAAVVASALVDKSRRYASEADDRESIALWMESQRRTVFTALELMPEGPEKTETLREIILDASHSMGRMKQNEAVPPPSRHMRRELPGSRVSADEMD